MPANFVMTMAILLMRWKRLPRNAKIGVPALALLIFIVLPFMVIFFPNEGWTILPWLALVALSCTTIPNYKHPVYAD